ncbi:hypothetical protein HDU85_004193 [Gaertneriomyces sp. JEL0708]|nr:hypothetical protein HDU85_004193 [Gaertneriomyces sp. JEL0708]
MADVETTQDRPDYSETTPPPENGTTEEKDAPEEQPPNLDELWSAILTLDKTGDFDDLKDSIYEYFRWAKHETFYTINAKFREANAKTHLVAEERVLPPSKELVDLQGNGNRKFIVEIVRNPRALKLKLKTDEQFTENDRRLKEEAGIIRERERKDGKYELEEWQMNRLTDKQKCAVKLGITSASVPTRPLTTGDPWSAVAAMKKVTKPAIVLSLKPADAVMKKGIMYATVLNRKPAAAAARKPDTRFNCRNCNEPGHKAAECDKPRKERDPNACRRCGSLEHRVHDCPEPDRRVCNLCGERGHVSHACPNPNGAPADTQDTAAPDGGNDDSYGASYDKSAFDNMWNSSEPEASAAGGW